MDVQGAFDSILDQIEDDTRLFEPGQLTKRMDALELMDTLPMTSRRADELRGRLEAMNEGVYKEIRRVIQSGASPLDVVTSLVPVTGDPGLSFDHLDELVSGVLQLREPEHDERLEPEMVFYQPTPVRHILRLIELTQPTAADTVIDLGSGLGHVPLLVAMLTPARAVGVEVQASYVRSARECADGLVLRRVQFVQEDVRAAELVSGTIFYLYTPFTGSILDEVLAKLRALNRVKSLKLVSFGPCTNVLANESWLRPWSQPDAEQVTVFEASA